MKPLLLLVIVCLILAYQDRSVSQQVLVGDPNLSPQVKRDILAVLKRTGF